MAIMARWIRVHPPGIPALQAVCAGFARAQAPDAPPAVLWAGGEDPQRLLAIVAPLKFLPGRDTRWRAWLLAPLVATYRQCGLSAYTDAERICLSGQPISGVGATRIGASRSWSPISPPGERRSWSGCAAGSRRSTAGSSTIPGLRSASATPSPRRWSPNP